jgi:hypothetical protein
LKVQNIYNKALFKVKNAYNKTGFKIACFVENQRICSTQKGAQNIANFFGYFFQQKNSPRPSKNSRNGEVSPHLVTLITDYLAEAKKHCSLRTETSYLLFRIGKPLRKYSFAPNVELKFKDTGQTLVV